MGKKGNQKKKKECAKGQPRRRKEAKGQRQRGNDYHSWDEEVNNQQEAHWTILFHY